jgi:hypothetical protein
MQEIQLPAEVTYFEHHVAEEIYAFIRSRVLVPELEFWAPLPLATIQGIVSLGDVDAVNKSHLFLTARGKHIFLLRFY